MKNRQKPLRTLVNAAVISVLTTGAAHAAGFALYGESAGYTTGNYGAGVAAEASDASTGWYNPAGLALLRDQQAVFGGVGVFPSIKLNGSSDYNTNGGQLGTLNYHQDFNGLNGGYNAFVPSFHYALPVGERTTLGLSMVAPFGLATDWKPDSPVRYSATYTELLTTNISPELGTQITDHFALGAGMDFQYSRVKFNQVIGAPTLFQILDPANPMVSDSISQNKGSSWGLGFHVGGMAMFNDNHTRIGLNYQSRVRHVFYGHSRLSGVLANDFNLLQTVLPGKGVWQNNDLFSDPIEFPDVVNLSAYHDVNDRLAILGSVIYTGWDVVKKIQLNNVAAPNIAANFNVSQANVNFAIPQNFSNAWRAVLGANYHVNPKLMLRMGGGYDQTPVNNVDRNVRLPDANRWAIAVGAHYQMRPNVGVDLGYTHLFSGGNSHIHSRQQLSPTSTYNVDSDSSNITADLVGAQVVWVLDKIQPVPSK